MEEERPDLISREDFAKALESFFMEAQGLVISDAEKVLAESAEIRAELDESLALMRDPRTSREQLIALAVGIVDEFVQANWENVVEESYALYVDMNGGRSKHHPAGNDGSDGV